MKRLIEGFDCPASRYTRREQPVMGIYDKAWDHIIRQGIEPKFVFAHPDILEKYPQTSLHYRGMPTLSFKRAQKVVASVKKMGRRQNQKQ